MKHIFINLKRFEVARELGGVCDTNSPQIWIEDVLEECIALNLGRLEDVAMTFFLPEALIITAVNKLNQFAKEKTAYISVGCQGVYREDIKVGGNFGAFTTNFPATAAKTIGCDWTILGHSEERKHINGIIECCAAGHEMEDNAVDKLINKQVNCALAAGLKVLYCIGETAEEKGSGSFAEQSARIKVALEKQLRIGLHNTDIHCNNLAIGYEPVWAIGPGKIPPKADYINFVSTYIKDCMQDLYGMVPPVVYGGGLKEENAAEIASVKNIDGGLVALTRFSGNIGFYPQDLKKIIEKYIGM
jgi:triosephosphate isomerase